MLFYKVFNNRQFIFRYMYILTVVDEYSRFSFAIPCPDISSSTVIKCLDAILALCGMPSFIHSDRGTSFMSSELKRHLTNIGIATNKNSPYHPIGNGQVERYNGIIWKSIRLALATQKIPVEQWGTVLQLPIPHHMRGFSIDLSRVIDATLDPDS